MERNPKVLLDFKNFCTNFSESLAENTNKLTCHSSKEDRFKRSKRSKISQGMDLANSTALKTAP